MRPPDGLLAQYVGLFEKLGGPVLDVACGDGHNGIFLASKGCEVVLADVSGEALQQAGALAGEHGAKVFLWQVDLEKGDANPFQDNAYDAILVFRYLHRPLMPCIQKALKKNGIILYETFTVDQPRFGKPRNPDFLLEHGELQKWFEGWEVIFQFDGILGEPERAVAQMVCRKTC